MGSYSTPKNPPAAKFASQGDAHVRTNAQIKLLLYPLHMCRVYFHQASNYGKIRSKSWENTIILMFKKVTQLVAQALVTIRKNK